MESVNDNKIVQKNFVSNLVIGLYNLQLLKQKYHPKRFIIYLNINSLSNKNDALIQICKISLLEILFVDESKLY